MQHAIAAKKLKIVKRPGKELAPYVGTKAGIASGKMWEVLEPFGVVRAAGRASASHEAAGTAS